MSIVIKGFNLPNSCADCPLEIDGRCGGLAGEPLPDGYLGKIDRPMVCPLEEDATGIVLTKDEAFAVANHIDATLIETIRTDTDIDSMKWLRGVIHAYEKLCQYSGYVGMTESEGDEP